MSLCESQIIVPTFHDNPLGWKTPTGLEISLPGIMYLIVFFSYFHEKHKKQHCVIVCSVLNVVVLTKLISVQ